MKKQLFLLVIFLLGTAFALKAQDVIITLQAERIDAKVLEVSKTEVRYKKLSNPDGPVFVLSTDEIASILYANGEAQTFMKEPPTKQEDLPKIAKPKLDEVLYRDGGRIVSNKSFIYEPENLRNMLGKEAYDNYLMAQSQYLSGQTMVLFGWVGLPLGIGLTYFGFKDGVAWTATTGYLIIIASNILLPAGYVVRGIGAGRISRIAENYNAQGSLSMDMAVSPTLLTADGKPAPGIGITLRF